MRPRDEDGRVGVKRNGETIPQRIEAAKEFHRLGFVPQLVQRLFQEIEKRFEFIAINGIRCRRVERVKRHAPHQFVKTSGARLPGRFGYYRDDSVKT